MSLSMKFQASRFSASGRKMPLEPRRSEACRSCQPMHVLSFGEGRKWFVFGPNKRTRSGVLTSGLGAEKKVLEYTGSIELSTLPRITLCEGQDSTHSDIMRASRSACFSRCQRD